MQVEKDIRNLQRTQIYPRQQNHRSLQDSHKLKIITSQSGHKFPNSRQRQFTLQKTVHNMYFYEKNNTHNILKN